MVERADDLARLADLLEVSAGVLRDLMLVPEAAGDLDEMAADLERIAASVREAGTQSRFH